MRRLAIAAAAALFAALPASAQVAMQPSPPVDSSLGWSALVPFAAAPFPYDGVVPESGRPFLDVREAGRLGHTSERGGVYWQDQTYADRRSLLFIPHGFTFNAPAALVVFFHGNDATVERDVIGRQRVADQLVASGINAVLAAPQFAFNAFDSSAGRFWNPGAFGGWLDEAAGHFAELAGDLRLRPHFRALPVILVSYSGGYLPAAYALTVGRPGQRICGVILLDSIYGETERFAAWTASRRDAFLVSVYSLSAAVENESLQAMLAARGIGYGTGIPEPIMPGSVTFLRVEAEHDSYVTRSFVRDPLAYLLARMPAC